MNNIIEYFWIFVLGSFIGFLSETIWCLIRWKKLESRKGLIYGHFVPIYGIGALLISIIVEYLNLNNSILIFSVSFIVCAIVEFISSYLQEKCFATKSWDYSNMRGNFHGRINLLYITAWSILGVLWCKYYKVITSFIIISFENIDILKEITLIGLIFMIYNCYISCVAGYRQKLRRKGIKAKNKYEEWIDTKYNDQRMNKIYANAKYVG